MTDERANNDWQHAYVACFPGTAQDETKYAKQVTDYLGISHTFMNIDSAVSEREFCASFTVLKNSGAIHRCR